MKSDLNASTAAVAYAAELDGWFRVGGPAPTYRGQPYTLSWFSKQDLPQSHWDRRDEVSGGWLRYHVGIDAETKELLVTGDYKAAFERLWGTGGTIYNPDLRETNVLPQTEYISTQTWQRP